MDLLDLLEIDRTRLPHRTRQAMTFVQHRWYEGGAPKEPKALADFLDKALRSCVGLELFYPKIFLRRLKQLQRHEWIPRVQTAGEGTQARRDTSISQNRRPDPDDDLVQRIREKEKNGNAMDEDMKGLLVEKLRRARERRQHHKAAGEWVQVDRIAKDLDRGQSNGVATPGKGEV